MKMIKQYWWVLLLLIFLIFKKKAKPFYKKVKVFGDKDSEVKDMQTALNKHLSTKLVLDGIYGYNTGAGIYVVLEKKNALNEDYLKIDQGPYGDYVSEIDLNWLMNQI